MAQVFDQSRVGHRIRDARTRLARHTVELPDPQRLRIGDGAGDAVVELLLPGGVAGDAAIPRRPVARGQVVQDHRNAAGVELRQQHGRRDLVRELHLDGAKAGLSGPPDPVGQGHLGEEHRKVGGETWHAIVLEASAGRAQAQGRAGTQRVRISPPPSPTWTICSTPPPSPGSPPKKHSTARTKPVAMISEASAVMKGASQSSPREWPKTSSHPRRAAPSHGLPAACRSESGRPGAISAITLSTKTIKSSSTRACEAEGARPTTVERVRSQQ